jgi:hypothetical protein
MENYRAARDIIKEPSPREFVPPEAWLNLDERSSMQEHTIGSDVLARFWAKVNKNGPVHTKLGTPCWLWTAAISSNGYGGLTVEGKSWTAHTFSWVTENGFIPDGLYVCHECDVRKCVNPAHLFLGTPTANNHDMIEKGRYRGGCHLAGANHPNAKLTETLVFNILALEGVLSSSEVAETYSVSASSVRNIWTGKTWGHLTGRGMLTLREPEGWT